MFTVFSCYFGRRVLRPKYSQRNDEPKMEFTEGWRSKKPLNPLLGRGKRVWIFHGAYFYSWLYGAYVNPSICLYTILYSLLREQKILATYQGNHFSLLQTVIIFLLNNVCCTCKLTMLEIVENFLKKDLQMLYLLFQPTSMRAIRARYNPYLQTRHRMDQVS